MNDERTNDHRCNTVGIYAASTGRPALSIFLSNTLETFASHFTPFNCAQDSEYQVYSYKLKLQSSFFTYKMTISRNKYHDHNHSSK